MSYSGIHFLNEYRKEIENKYSKELNFLNGFSRDCDLCIKAYEIGDKWLFSKQIEVLLNNENQTKNFIIPGIESDFQKFLIEKDIVQLLKNIEIYLQKGIVAFKIDRVDIASHFLRNIIQTLGIVKSIYSNEISLKKD